MKLITKAKPNTTVRILTLLVILVLIVVFLVIPLTRKDKPVVTETGKLTITQTGDRTELVTLEIEDKLPFGNAPKIDTYTKDGVYKFEQISNDGNKTTYQISPIKAGVSMLDLEYTKGGEYQRLHYTLEVLSDGRIRMYTVFVSEDPKEND